MNPPSKLVRGAGAHDEVMKDILLGRWMPGEKLQPGALATRYDTSTTVIREALTRLAGERFLVLRPNRGFFVPQLSLAELSDLTEVRCVTEGLAIGLAIDRGDVVWESELIAAHHQLARTPRRGVDDPQHVADRWSVAHRGFHEKLIDACRVPVLVDLSRRLSDATDLYRRWAAPSPAAASRDVEQEHADIVEATVARDADRAGRLLRAHYEQTIAVILASGLVTGVEAPPEG